MSYYSDSDIERIRMKKDTENKLWKCANDHDNDGLYDYNTDNNMSKNVFELNIKSIISIILHRFWKNEFYH